MKEPFKIPLSHFVAISASGLGIGFLVGLSGSPVINAVLAGILSLVAAVVGALSGVRLEKSKPEAKLAENPDDAGQDGGSPLESNAVPFAARVSPAPMAFLVIAIVAGSLLGLRARTHEWFAETPEHLVQKWQKSTDLSPKDIARRLFDSIYGTAKVETKLEDTTAQKETKLEDTKTSDTKSVHEGIFFAVAEDVCKRLRSLDPKDPQDAKKLRLELEGLGYPEIKEFASQCKDDEDLKVLLDSLVCPDRDH